MPAATIAAGPGGPAEGRALVTGWFGERVTTAVLDHARMLVSELITNSLRHAEHVKGAPVRLSGVLTPGLLRIEVADAGHDSRVVRRDPHAPGGAGGFGLHLVELMAARWGVEPAAGTEVWFELSWAATA